MDEQYTLQLLKSIGAIITDTHVVYASGRHGSAYVDHRLIYANPDVCREFCKALADKFAYDVIQVVIGPVTGGAILAHEVAGCFREHGYTVHGLYADEVERNIFQIPQCFERLIRGKYVLVVEDIMMTGNSAKSVVHAVHTAGGIVVGVGVIWVRNQAALKTFEDAGRFLSLIETRLDDWSEADCPLCAQNIPVNTDVGRGREYLERKRLRQEI